LHQQILLKINHLLESHGKIRKTEEKASRNHPLKNLIKKNQRNISTYVVFCKHANSTESRKHLLSDCPKTIHLLTSYAANLEYISAEKYLEYCSLVAIKRWLWILGGGFINYTTKQNQSKYHFNKIESPFEKGESVSPGINKDNPHECSKAFFEYKSIESRLPMNAITVFTDGSVKDNKAGAGVAVYYQHRFLWQITAPFNSR